MKWVAKVGCAGLLNMLWVLHFSRSTINTICVHQLLMLVHDWCLWLGGPIPITDMLIHWITLLPYQGIDPVDAFIGKSQEKKLADQMKSDFRLVKKLCDYAISSISDGVVQFTTQILVGKIMRKCHADEVLVPMVSRVAQCTKGVQYNWVKYLCHDFLEDFREARDEGKAFHYTWLLLLITLVAWRTPKESQFP